MDLAPSELTTLSGSLVNYARAYDVSSRSFTLAATVSLDYATDVSVAIIDSMSTASQELAATMLTRVTASNSLSDLLNTKIENFIVSANEVDQILLSTLEVNNTEQIALHSALVSRTEQRTNEFLVSLDTLENTFIKTDNVTKEVDKFVSSYDGLLDKVVPSAVESDKGKTAMKAIYSLTIGTIAGSLT